MIYPANLVLPMYQALAKGLDSFLDVFTHWEDEDKNLLKLDVDIDVSKFSKREQIVVCRSALELVSCLERLETIIQSIYFSFKENNIKDPTKH